MKGEADELRRGQKEAQGNETEFRADGGRQSHLRNPSGERGAYRRCRHRQKGG